MLQDVTPGMYAFWGLVRIVCHSSWSFVQPQHPTWAGSPGEIRKCKMPGNFWGSLLWLPEPRFIPGSKYKFSSLLLSLGPWLYNPHLFHILLLQSCIMYKLRELKFDSRVGSYLMHILLVPALVKNCNSLSSYLIGNHNLFLKHMSSGFPS